MSFDPLDTEYPVKLNLLEGAYRNPGLRATQITGIFERLHRDSWGPRSAQYLRQSIYALAHLPGATLCDVPRLLRDEAFRFTVLSEVSDPVARSYWADYQRMSAAQRRNEIAPLLNKIEPLLLPDSVRNIIGQPTVHQENGRPRQAGGLDPRRLLADRKLVIIRLPKGELGTPITRLFGSLLIDWLYQAAQGVPRHRRRRFLFFIGRGSRVP